MQHSMDASRDEGISSPMTPSNIRSFEMGSTTQVRLRGRSMSSNKYQLVRGTVTPTDIMINGNGDDRPMKQSLSVDLLEGAGLPGTPGNEDAGFFKRVGSGGSLHFRNVPNSPSRSVVKERTAADVNAPYARAVSPPTSTGTVKMALRPAQHGDEAVVAADLPGEVKGAELPQAVETSSPDSRRTQDANASIGSGGTGSRGQSVSPQRQTPINAEWALDGSLYSKALSNVMKEGETGRRSMDRARTPTDTPTGRGTPISNGRGTSISNGSGTPISNGRGTSISNGIGTPTASSRAAAIRRVASYENVKDPNDEANDGGFPSSRSDGDGDLKEMKWGQSEPPATSLPSRARDAHGDRGAVYASSGARDGVKVPSLSVSQGSSPSKDEMHKPARPQSRGTSATTRQNLLEQGKVSPPPSPDRSSSQTGRISPTTGRRMGSARTALAEKSPTGRSTSRTTDGEDGMKSADGDSTWARKATKGNRGIISKAMETISADEARIVTINCGGIKHQTFIHTLRKFPGTLLADLANPPMGDQPAGALYTKGEIFIDRNTTAFEYIINFYRTDRLFQPNHIPDEIWNSELVFYKIQNPLMRVPTEQERISIQIEAGMPVETSWMWQIRKPIWLLFEDPSSSIFARMISMFSIFIIITGVTAFVTETHPIFRTSGRDDEIMGVKTYTVNRAFGIVEAVVVAFFTIELLCRFICNTKKIRFFRQPSNIVDVLAIAPFYFNIFGVQGGSGTYMLRVIRLVRIFRVIGLVFKLGKYSSGARVLGGTIRACLRELTILAVVLIMAVVLYGSGIYFCENPDVEAEIISPYSSIIVSMYWAVITLSTVGYGDLSPTTSCGQFVACFAALSGIFCIGLPISIITAKFTERYAEMVREWKIEEERLRLQKTDKELSKNRAILGLGSRIASMVTLESGMLSKLSSFIPGSSWSSPVDLLEKVCGTVFKEVDVDGSGEIDCAELMACLDKLKIETSHETIDDLLEEIDIDKSGTVNLEEFTKFVTMAVAKANMSKGMDQSLMKKMTLVTRGTVARRF